MSDLDDTGNVADEERHGAIRFIFEYEGDQIRLLSRERVDVIAPPADIVQDLRERTGLWAELRDAEGSALYQRLLRDPVDRYPEVFSNDPNEQSIRRVPVEQPSGVFALLVPEPEGADQLALVRSTPDVKRLRSDVADVLRVPFYATEADSST